MMSSPAGMAERGSTSGMGAFGASPYYAPPPSSPYSKPPSTTTSRTGLLSGPGTAEQWWKDNQNRFRTPSQISEYWKGVQGRFTGGRVAPTNTREAWSTISPQLQSPGAGVTGARDISSYFRSGPTAGERTIGEAANMYRAPGTGEQWAQQHGNYFTTGGAFEDLASEARYNLRQRGAGETNAYDVSRQLQQSGVAEGNYDNARRALSGIKYGDQGIKAAYDGTQRAGNTAQFFGTNIAPMAKSNPIADERNFFAQGLRDKSYSEQAYESGAGGLIDPYARTQEKQARAMNNELAARGMYNSGAALRSHAELGADVAAAEARDRIALAGQADQARLGRTGAALDFVGAEEAAGRARSELGLRGAMSADEGHRANAGLMLGAYGQASGEALQKVGLETNAANIAQQNQIQRLLGSSSTGLAADSAGRDRLSLSADISERADRFGLDRMSQGWNVAQGSQNLAAARAAGLASSGNMLANTEIQRLLGAGNLGLSADQSDLARLQQLFSGAQGLDNLELQSQAADLNWLTQGGNLASQVDQTDWGRFMDEFGAAGEVQNFFENRVGGEFERTAGLAAQKVETVARALGIATDEIGNLSQREIAARLVASGMDAAEAEKMAEEALAGAATIIRTRR